MAGRYNKYCLIFFIFVTFYPKNGTPANILSIAFMSTQSHKITYQPLLEALAKRGHNVTIVSPIPAKKSVSNIREILTSDVDASSYMPDFFKQKQEQKTSFFTELLAQVLKSCNDGLDMPHIRALEFEKFDLIFVPAIQNECLLGFISRFQTSYILISPFGVPAGLTGFIGSPSPPSFVPHVFGGLTDRMNFMERVTNFITEMAFEAYMIFSYLPTVEKMYRHKLGQDTPDLFDIYKNLSLILSNSHFSTNTIRPFTPDIIEVGGMHCQEPKPLPKDLEDFVATSGDDGFILFSMGSVLKSNNMPPEKIEVLRKVFSKLKQKVIWKWDSETMENIPKNVKLSKWLPQQDVLGHPKIKAFISHGGLGGTTEAIYHGVPIIGFPIFSDQELNMKKAREAGYAIVLDFNTLTEDNLLNAINQILVDSRYKINVQKISAAFRDQPVHPLDNAVYWSEYVIRHKGAHHLRSAARDLGYLQYYSIDVIGFISAILLFVTFILFKVVKALWHLVSNLIFQTRNPKVAENKKKRN